MLAADYFHFLYVSGLIKFDIVALSYFSNAIDEH